MEIVLIYHPVACSYAEFKSRRKRSLKKNKNKKKESQYTKRRKKSQFVNKDHSTPQGLQLQKYRSTPQGLQLQIHTPRG